MAAPSKSEAASVDLWKRLKQLREESPKPSRSARAPLELNNNTQAAQAAEPIGGASLDKPSGPEVARSLGGQLASLLQGCNGPPVVEKPVFTKEKQLEIGRQMDQ